MTRKLEKSKSVSPGILGTPHFYLQISAGSYFVDSISYGLESFCENRIIYPYSSRS